MYCIYFLPLCSCPCSAHASVDCRLLPHALCHDGPSWNERGPDESWCVRRPSHLPPDERGSSCSIWTLPYGNGQITSGLIVWITQWGPLTPRSVVNILISVLPGVWSSHSHESSRPSSQPHVHFWRQTVSTSLRPGSRSASERNISACTFTI